MHSKNYAKIKGAHNHPLQNYNKMKQIQTTPIHCLAFLYLAFAHQTDGELDSAERTAIWKRMIGWLDKEITRVEFAKTMDETIEWYQSKMLDNAIVEDVYDIAERLTEFEWFNKKKRIDSLRDLQMIAMADNKFTDNEKKWIKQIAQIWGVSPTRFIKPTP